MIEIGDWIWGLHKAVCLFKMIPTFLVFGTAEIDRKEVKAMMNNYPMYSLVTRDDSMIELPPCLRYIMQIPVLLKHLA